MTRQMTIMGEAEWVGTDTEDVALLFDKYPAAEHDRGLFFWLMLKMRCPWVAQLPEQRRNELVEYLDDIESLRRRAQELKAKS